MGGRVRLQVGYTWHSPLVVTTDDQNGSGLRLENYLIAGGREGGEGLPYDEFLTGVSVTESSLELYRSAVDHPTDSAKGSSLKS